MSTGDVPGANPSNADELHIGCWAEHEDGSLLLVKGILDENGTERVVYELYDVATEPMVFTDVMPRKGFEKTFSRPPTGRSTERWTWHDKTPFPWERVIAQFPRAPRPQHVTAEHQLSAAQRVAEALKLRGRRLSREDIEAAAPTLRAVVDKIADAVKSLLPG